MVVQNTYEFQTYSDCEVIIPLINELGTNGIKLLDGIFSFIYYDKINNNFIVARDPIGVTLFIMVKQNTEKWFFRQN